MKLTTREIDGFLKNRPSVPVVLIYGPDQGLVRERAQILLRFVVPDLADPFNVAILSGGQITDDPARLNDEAQALSLMGGDRVVWVRDASDGIAPAVKSYLSAPNPQALVVIEAADLTPKSSLRKLVEGATNAAALPCYVQDAGELARVIGQTIRAADLTIDPDAVDFLAGHIGGDGAQVRGTLDKLLTYMGATGTGQAVTSHGHVTYDDAVACTGSMGLAALDGCVDALLSGHTDQAFILLKRLADEEGYPIILLRALLAHGRKLHRTHLRIEAGERIEDILSGRDAPVFFKRKAAFATHLKRWPVPKLLRLMDDIWGCESKMKSGVDPLVVIPQTLLSLSVRAQKAG